MSNVKQDDGLVIVEVILDGQGQRSQQRLD